MNEPVQTPQHMPFFDNLRSLMVVLVLVFHAGASYSSSVDFWPFHDINPSGLIDLFMLLCDVFLMSVLFFIAGYFALPSIRKHGGSRFIVGKLKRLGLPWIVITVGVMPLLDYVHYTAKNTAAISFGSYWIASMGKIAEFNFGWLEMDSYRPMTEHFYQRYVWYISLLLLFFLVFAALHKHILNKASTKHSLPVWLAFVIGGTLSIAPFAIVKLFVYQDILASGWVTLGNIFQFQLGKVFIYIGYFALGVYAFANDWFKSGSSIGKCWIWGIWCLAAFGMNMLVFKLLSENSEPLFVVKVAHTVLYPLWILSFVGLFLSLAFRYWNKATPPNRRIAQNSYNMYLVHYICPMLLPLLLRNVTIPTLVKFGIVAVITVLASYAVSLGLLHLARASR